MARNFKPLETDDIDLKADMGVFFGDDGDSSLTEFYRGGNLVPNNNFNSGIPTGGTIAMSDFRGATNETYQLRVDAHPVNSYDEGDTVVMTLTTTNVPDDTVIWSRTTGITPEDDIVGGVGTTHADFPFTVSSNTATVSFQIKNDYVSDGGLDGNGIPLAGNETATTTLYTGAVGTSTPIGGGEGAVSWQIVDSSLSWYATIEAPTAVEDGIRIAAAVAQTMQRQENYAIPVVSTVAMPIFTMKADYNNPSYSITAEFDTDYGRTVEYQQITNSQLGNNVTLGNGNSYNPTTWTNTTNPSITVTRSATWPVDLLEDNNYQMIIRERARFIFTEIGGQGRVLGTTEGAMNFTTPLCILKTTHNFVVSGS